MNPHCRAILRPSPSPVAPYDASDYDRMDKLMHAQATIGDSGSGDPPYRISRRVALKSSSEHVRWKSGGSMEAKLIVVGGKASKTTIALKLPTMIGRSREAGLTIPHPMISRQHCEVFEADGLLMVRDLGSLNGTMVGGRRIKESPLPPDAEFTVGPLTFRAEYAVRGRPEQTAAARVGRRRGTPLRPLRRTRRKSQSGRQAGRSQSPSRLPKRAGQ